MCTKHLVRTFFGASLLFILISFLSCEESRVVEIAAFEKKNALVKNGQLEANPMYLPPELIENNDFVSDNGSMDIGFNQDFIYIGIDENGRNLIANNGISIVCYCDKVRDGAEEVNYGGVGCNPYLNKLTQEAGCADSFCEDCEDGVRLTSHGEIIYLNKHISSGFLSLSEGVSFRFEKGGVYPMGFEAMLENSWIRKKMDEFLIGAVGLNGIGNKDNKGLNIIYLNVFGRAVGVKLSNENIQKVYDFVEDNYDKKGVAWPMQDDAKICHCVHVGGDCLKKENDFYIICENLCQSRMCEGRFEIKLNDNAVIGAGKVVVYEW